MYFPPLFVPHHPHLILFFSSTGAVSARNIMLLKKKQARYLGVVCAMKVSVIKFDKLEFFSLAVLSLKTQGFIFLFVFPLKNINLNSNLVTNYVL